MLLNLKMEKSPFKSFMKKNVFITGISGFIGFHLAKALIKRGDFVVGCDNFNEYYPKEYKKARLKILKDLGIEVFDHDIKKLSELSKVFEKHSFTHLFHLAAQPGVRYSLKAPRAYINNNIDGFFEVLEHVKNFKPIKLIYASSSSVYGHNTKIPFSEDDPVDHPVSLYAATKKANELIAHSYHHLYGISCVGLRFFTVYGPYGRPDMAYFSFAKAIEEKKPIDVFNHGNMKRDFTYIDDIIDGCLACIDKSFDYEIFNLGNNKPEKLSYLIVCLEESLGQKAHLNMKPMQPGDVFETYADISKAQKLLNFSPKTSLKEGIEHFVNWYRHFHP